jgi:N-acyl-D-amino-acid deacylase
MMSPAFAADETRPGANPANSARTAPLPSFDREVEQFMRARGTPGGALAVVRDGRLVYARGYGFADRERSEPVRADSLFRLASVSKPITALAIMKLFESGRLDPEARVMEVLELPAWVLPGDHPDPRWQKITLRHLLHHTAGWDRDKSFDPMFRPEITARTVGVPPPAGPQAIIKYMLGQPLDFDPGARYAYSNFGYCLLGRVIERLSGLSYDEYVKRIILAPLGITHMRLGASLDGRRADREVRYYTTDGKRGRSVFPSAPEESSEAAQVPVPYGGFYLEAMDSHGGWLASVLDLARLTIALDDPQASPLLKPATFATLYERPDAPVWRQPDGSPTDYYYACGWLVRPVGAVGKANYWHNGSLPGTYTLWVRRWDKLSWIALFNQRSENPKLPDGELDPALHRAASAVTVWPAADLLREPPASK